MRSWIRRPWIGRPWIWLALSLWNVAGLADGLGGDWQRIVSLRRDLQYLVDPRDERAPRDLIRLAAQLEWRPVAGAALPARSKRYYWFRLALHNPASTPVALLLAVDQPRQRVLNVYSSVDGELLGSFEAGDGGISASGSLPHPQLLFPLSIASRQQLDLFLQISGRPAAIPVQLSLWSRDGYLVQLVSTYSRDWFLLGLLAAIAIWNFGAFSLVRQPAWLWCGTYLAIELILLTEQFGYGAHIPRPGWPEFDDFAAGFLPALMGVIGTLFTISFFRLRERFRCLTRALQGYCIILLTMAVAHPLLLELAGLERLVAVLTGIGGLCSWLIALFISGWKTEPGARLYCFGWAGYLFALLWSGADPYAVAPANTVAQRGLLAQAVLFSVALAQGTLHRWAQNRRMGRVSARRVAVLEREEQFLRARLHAIRMLVQQPPGTTGPNLRLVEKLCRGLVSRLDDTRDEALLLGGPLQPVFGEFELAGVVRQALAEAALQARPGLLLYGAIDPHLPTRLIGDAPRLQRLLASVLEQAVTGAGAGPREVALRLGTASQPDPGAEVVVMVSLSIPEAGAQAEALLPSRVQRLVVALGGTGGVHVHASVQLWLRLPLRRAEAQPPPRVPVLPSPRVLLLVESRAYRRELARILGSQGYLVDSADDAAQALARVAGSQCGDRRYDWLVAQVYSEDACPDRLLQQIRERWPCSAVRLLELTDTAVVVAGSARRRPLLCNDLAALLQQASAAVADSPQSLAGLRVLVAAADRDLRTALIAVVAARGGVPTGAATGRDLARRYRRRDAAAPAYDVTLMMCGCESAQAEIGRLRAGAVRCGQRGPPLLVLAGQDDGCVQALRDAGADRVLDQTVAADILVQALAELAEQSSHRLNAGPRGPAGVRSRWRRQWRD